MTRARTLVVLAACVALGTLATLGTRAAAAPRSAAAARPGGTGGVVLRLGARLRARGRAECTFTRTAVDPWSSRTVTTRGRLALEPPDRARLDLPATGERITLRGDGGEWVQPRLQQVITFSPGQAAAARRWWQLLIDGAAPGITATPRSGRVVLLVSSANDAGPDSARLVLDAAGLPARLEVPDAGGRTEFRFSGWTFPAPRGAAAFQQATPPGYDRVEAP